MGEQNQALQTARRALRVVSVGRGSEPSLGAGPSPSEGGCCRPRGCQPGQAEWCLEMAPTLRPGHFLQLQEENQIGKEGERRRWQWRQGRGSNALPVADDSPCASPGRWAGRGIPETWWVCGGRLRKHSSFHGPAGSTAVGVGHPCLGGQCRFGAGDPPTSPTPCHLVWAGTPSFTGPFVQAWSGAGGFLPDPRVSA